jgi:uncharacterized membrane protein YqjE
MDAALGLGQQAKGPQTEVAGTPAQVGMDEEMANLMQPPAVLMLVMLVLVLVMLVFMVVMMVVLMLDRPGGLERLMQAAIDHDIDFG